MWLRRLRQVMRPDAYHGEGWRPPFFEGWYLKVVGPTRARRLALIPGVYRGTAGEDSHAFIQVFDGERGEAHYVRYPLDAFTASPKVFDVRIAGSRFSVEGVRLDIDTPALRAEGALTFGSPRPWPVRVRAPGIMGWYAWVPFMECYQGVVSLDHGVTGTVTIAGRQLDLSGGHGYIEKDWGRSFPSCWVWTQCNHLLDGDNTRIQGACVTASIAEIPWIGYSFPGFIVGVLCDGELHTFATYNGARVQHLAIDDRRIVWRMRRRALELVLEIERAAPTVLPGPTIAGMRREVHETLNATVTVELRRTRGRGRGVLLRARGEAAGLEVQGDVSRLCVQ